MDKKKHIVAITAVIKNKQGNKVLVAKRGANEVAYPGKWAFPGGKLEQGERIIDALKREVLEEVGLEIEDKKRFLEDFTFLRKDGHNVVGLCFEVFAKSEDVKLDKDFDEYKWVSLDELNELDCIPGMEKEVELAFVSKNI